MCTLRLSLASIDADASQVLGEVPSVLSDRKPCSHGISEPTYKRSKGAASTGGNTYRGITR